MPDFKETLNFAEKIENAAPVDSSQSTTQVNLSSSYLVADSGENKSDAFLTDATVDKHIDNAEQISNEVKQQAQIQGLDLSPYDPLAEEREKAIAAEKARLEAENQKKAKIRAEQKEKLTNFLKGQSEKDKKLGYSRGVLAGFLLSLLLISGGIFAFRYQVAEFLSRDFDGFNLNSMKVAASDYTNQLLNKSESSSTMLDDDLTLNNDENEEQNSEILDDSENTLDDSEDLEIADLEEIQNSEDDTNLDESNEKDVIENSVIKNSVIENSIIDSEIDSKINSDDQNDINIKENETKDQFDEMEQTYPSNYTITHVYNEEEANRVIPDGCDSLYCGHSTNKTFSLCQEFRFKEDIEDDAPRIGNGGVCRYKDISELVYVSFE